MIATSDLPTLYKTKKVYLWVEDEETRTYLTEVWQDPEIGLLVAGGHTNLQAVVASSRQEGFAHVFGFCDRDLGQSNRARWNEKTTVVMKSEALELENLLLDSVAMAACDVNTSGKSAAQIEVDLVGLATELPWWMSCRKAITEIRDAVVAQLIEHPKRGGIKTQADAEKAIFETPWWIAVLPNIGTNTTRPRVEASLQLHHASYSAMLGNGQWRTHFSGKEVLRDMATRVWTRKRSPRLHFDFIQSIGRAQRVAGQIPAEIKDLRDALRAHVGLSPSVW